jgi:hypothetical protein
MAVKSGPFNETPVKSENGMREASFGQSGSHALFFWQWNSSSELVINSCCLIYRQVKDLFDSGPRTRRFSAANPLRRLCLFKGELPISPLVDLSAGPGAISSHRCSRQ